MGSEIEPDSQDCRLVSLQFGELAPQLLMSNIVISPPKMHSKEWSQTFGQKYFYSDAHKKVVCNMKTFKSETTPRSVLSNMIILSSLVKARW